MIVYIKDPIAERLKKLADSQKRKVSEVVEILLDAHEKKVQK